MLFVSNLNRLPKQIEPKIIKIQQKIWGAVVFDTINVRYIEKIGAEKMISI